MGQVSLGRDVRSGDDVAIKLMHDHLVNDVAARARFRREAQIMARLRHPNTVALLDSALDDPEPPCLIMEYVPGASLELLTKDHGRLQVEAVARILSQVCQALYAAHSLGILHRDLSAENVMLDPTTGRVKVMDFGLARSGSGFFVPLEKLTGSGASIGGGTPDYMCPEQVRGETVDHRGDIYSTGVLLFKLLTGRLPFAEAHEVADILVAHVRSRPPRFADVGVRDVPAEVEAVVQSCLAKTPGERPQSARELAERFTHACRMRLVSDEDYPSPALEQSPAPDQQAAPAEDPNMLDRLEAWMPEQVASIKLRAFVEGVGGEVFDSEPGVLRVTLRDPRQKPQAVEKKGLLGFLGFGRKKLEDPDRLLLLLYMEKKEAGGRSLVQITVVLPSNQQGCGRESSEDQAMRRGFGERICRELRAYLMIGR